MDVERAVLLSEAERIGFPAVFFASGAKHLSGADGWRRNLSAVMPAELPQIKVQLESHAAQHDRAAAFEAVEAERDARLVERAGPPTEDEERAAARVRFEAADAVARHRAAHPDRVEALLARILKAIEKRP